MLGGALTELDLKLAKAKNWDAGSSTYGHFSTLLQKIALKQTEVETQHGYVALVDEMVTRSTLMTPNAQMSALVKQLRKASDTEHKTLKKMVSNTLIKRFTRSNSILIIVHRAEKTLKKKFTDVNSSISDGPFFATMEQSLKACKVIRQAYQGGTFVGNHVHKLLKVIKVLKLYAILNIANSL